MENKHRTIARNITDFLTKKGYKRDIPNNIFVKQISKKFYDFNEIRFYEGFIIISNLENKTIHKLEINKFEKFVK